MNVCNKEKQTIAPESSGGVWIRLLPTVGSLCLAARSKEMQEDGVKFRERPSKRRQGALGSLIFLLVILHGFLEDAVLQAVLEVVDHSPLEVLDAAWAPQNVALVWVQLEGVVGLHLHQSAQELRAVLEVDLRF